MVSPYKIAGYAGILSIVLGVLGVFVAGVLQRFGGSIENLIFYVTYALAGLFLSFIFYRGFLLLAKEIKDWNFYWLTILALLIIVISTIIVIIVVVNIYLETSTFSFYDYVMNNQQGSSRVMAAIMMTFFGIGLAYSKYPDKMARNAGIMYLVAVALYFTPIAIVGDLVYMIAFIMSIIILLNHDDKKDSTGKENDKPITNIEITKAN